MNALAGRNSKSLRAERARMWWVVGGGAVAIARTLREGDMVRMTPWIVSEPAIVVYSRTLYVRCLLSAGSLSLRYERYAGLKLLRLPCPDQRVHECRHCDHMEMEAEGTVRGDDSLCSDGTTKRGI